MQIGALSEPLVLLRPTPAADDLGGQPLGTPDTLGTIWGHVREELAVETLEGTALRSRRPFVVTIWRLAVTGFVSRLRELVTHQLERSDGARLEVLGVRELENRPDQLEFDCIEVA